MTEELLKISEALHCPLELDLYIKKLINTKHKVTVVSNILQTTQERLNKVHIAVEKNAARRRALLETTQPPDTKIVLNETENDSIDVKAKVEDKTEE